MQGLREEIVALQRRIKELESQNRALASVLVQQLQQGSPGETISKVPAGGAGDEPLAGHGALSVSVCPTTQSVLTQSTGLVNTHTETQHNKYSILKGAKSDCWLRHTCLSV